MTRDEEFSAFLDARYDALRRFAVLLAGDVWGGEDLLQTSLAKVFETWRRAERIGGPEAYVRKVMVRQIGRASRRKWRAEVPHEVVPEGRSSPDHAQGVAEAHAVLAALRALPVKQRVVLVLRYWDDLSEREIASVLGISPGTVKSRTARALQALRASGQLTGLGNPGGGAP